MDARSEGLEEKTIVDRLLQQRLIFLASCMPAGKCESRDARRHVLSDGCSVLCALFFLLCVVQNKIRDVPHYYGGELSPALDWITKSKLEPCPQSTEGDGEHWTPS